MRRTTVTSSRTTPEWVTPVLVLAAVALLVVLPLVVASFYLFLLTRILILGLFATAFNIVFGFGGMPSLGHAALFGIGGYVVGIAVSKSDLSFPVILVLALLSGTALGVVFGLFNLRARGIYLLLLTLALAQAVHGLAYQQVALTGGDNGISGITREGLPVPTSAPAFYWFTLVLVAMSLALMWTFMRSPVGMVITALRESESRLSATGYRVGGYRVAAFAVSGAFSALAGLLDTYLLGSVSPSSVAFLLSAEVVVFAILGGARYFLGPLLGAAIILALEFYVSSYTTRWTVVLGVLYVLTALFMQDGVLGRVTQLSRRLRRNNVKPAPLETEIPRPDEMPVLMKPDEMPVLMKEVQS